MSDLYIFDLTSGLKIIGELQNIGKENFILSYPGSLNIFPAQRPEDLKVNIVRFILPFIDNFETVVKKFYLSKNSVLYYGPAIRSLHAPYFNVFKKGMIEDMSGIEIVGAGALDRLKKPNLFN